MPYFPIHATCPTQLIPFYLIILMVIGASSPLLFNFTLEYANRKVPENQVGLKLNGTHQLLTYADDVKLMGDEKVKLSP
jgi:hypothetical protein